MALLCAGAWAQQQPARHGAGQRIPLQPKQENIQRQQADWTVITVSFDVKLPEGMSKENLSITLDNGSWVEYDPESGLYNAYMDVYEPFECTYHVDYYDNESDGEYFPLWGSFMADASKTIPVDMTGYHAASFATSDPGNWELSNLSISPQTDEPWADEAADSPWDLSAPYYLQPGQYTMEAVIRPTDGSYTDYYGAPAQPFTMGAEDAAFTFQVDPQRYHSVTIAATDREGKPLTSGSVRLTSSTGYCPDYGLGLSSDAGTIAYMLHDGEYHYEIEDNGQVYSSGDFTVAGSDTTIRATMSSDWLRLRVRVEGDLVSYFIDDEWASQYIRLTNTDDWQQAQVELRKEGDDALALPEYEPLYLKAGEYQYEMDWEEYGYQVKENGRFRLEGDHELVIDLSSDRYATVTFSVYDPDGNPLTDAATTLEITDSFLDKELFYNESPSATFFLLPGTYNARYEDDTYGVFNIPFTVEAGQQVEVPIRLERRDYATVRVRLQLPQEALADYYYMYEMDYCILNFGQNGIFEDNYRAGVSIDPGTGVGESEVSLPVGQYEYRWEPNSLRHQGTLDLQKDTLLTFDLTQTPYLQILLTDEAGQPLDYDNVEAACAVYQDPQEVMVGYYGFFGFLEPGTYQVYVSAYFYDEETDTDLNTTVARTVTMGTESQVLTIAVPDPDPDLFSVYFEFVEGAEYIYRSGTVSMNGQTSPVIEGNAYMSGIPAGTYTYTAQVDGYEPHTGTLEVNDQAVAYDKTIRVTVPLTRQEPVTGIGQVPADGSFRLFPTVATDALHILPVAATDGEWTVRITSPHGTAVYAARHVLDAETVLPVGTLAPGLYLLTLDNGTDMETYKFVKR